MNEDRDGRVEALRAQLEEHRDVVAEASRLLPDVERLATLIVQSLARGGRVLTFGNGGSAADAQHFAAELVGTFGSRRPALAALALSSDPSIVTAIANDFGLADVFARQVEGQARPGDVVIGITTSGRSENVVRGLAAARVRGATAVAFTGRDGNAAAEAADLTLSVASTKTARIQEAHTLLVHLVCGLVDAWAVERADSSAPRRPDDRV